MAALATREDHATMRRMSARAARDAITLAPGVTAQGAIVQVVRDAAIFAQEDEVTHVYKVISGAVRVTRLFADGRRHIVAFCFAGEMFGLEAGETHQFSAEAVVASCVAFVRRSTVFSETGKSDGAMGPIWRLMARELAHAQDHALVLGRLNAEERVCAFLRDMASRAGPGNARIWASARTPSPRAQPAVPSTERTCAATRRV